jgi:hypothetical protein
MPCIEVDGVGEPSRIERSTACARPIVGAWDRCRAAILDCLDCRRLALIGEARFVRASAV